MITPKPGETWWEVPILTRIKAPTAHAAQSRVHEILTLADMGHELADISETWTSGTARLLPTPEEDEAPEPRCPDCLRPLHGYRGPLCRYCDPDAYSE